jgi:outer membrane receptor for ferrienterochelin and colicin
MNVRSMLVRLAVLVLVLAAVVAPSTALGQAVQTGSLAGTVKSADGGPLPGVTVSVSSTALQGQRTTISAANGSYTIPLLPPGAYTVSFTMPGMRTVEKTLRISLGQPARADAVLDVVVTATVVAVAESISAPLVTTKIGTNTRVEEQVQKLPMGRTLAAIASYTPGVVGNTTATASNTNNVGQLRISGAFGYDNTYLLDGTDINDNLFATANNLFIEDAIQEVAVLSAGVSAEYGRFTGGVVNAISKTGGNSFSGSFRVDLTNSAWTDETPFEKSRNISRPSKTNPVYQATLGGPILKDALWFFGAGRMQESETATTLVASGIPFTASTENDRWELKLTGTIAGRHTLTGSYMDNATAQVNTSFAFTMDPRGTYDRTLPNNRWAVTYSGTLTDLLVAEASYSQKEFGFRNSGGTKTNIVDSPFLTRTGSQYHYNEPYFDSNDPEDRNNKDLNLSLAYFLNAGSFGSHELKVGYGRYQSWRTGGNSQSATSYVYFADFVRNADGTPKQEANGQFVPNFVPRGGTTTASQLINYVPVRGARVDLVTDAIFFNDAWRLSDHFSFSLGLRWEKVKGEATGDIQTVDSSRIVPRLAAVYDVTGDGKYVVKASYAQYSGKYNERQFAVNTNVGNPSSYTYDYVGPAGQGFAFGPGFDLTNWTLVTGSIPTANIFVDQDIASPVADEITLAAGAAVGRRGFVQASFIDRSWSSFWEDFRDTTQGKTAVTLPNGTVRTLDNIYYSNTDSLDREYQAIQLQARYDPLPNLRFNVGYTYEIKNEGNFEGEAANQPGNSSVFGNYPEILSEARHYPMGNMQGAQKHRVRLTGIWNASLGRLGRIDLGAAYLYDSGLPFSYTASVPRTAQQTALLPTGASAYAGPPTSTVVFFGERGAGKFESYDTLDLSLTYAIPVFKTVEPWVKFDVFNVFNSSALVTYDTTVTADNAGPKDDLGLPLNYIKGTNFGKATSSGNYQVPIGYQFSVGIRF